MKAELLQRLIYWAALQRPLRIDQIPGKRYKLYNRKGEHFGYRSVQHDGTVFVFTVGGNCVWSWDLSDEGTNPAEQIHEWLEVEKLMAEEDDMDSHIHRRRVELQEG